MMDEHLIKEVERHAIIYNRQKKTMGFKGEETIGKEFAWVDIATRLGTDIDTCKKRWKYLRERYVQQKKQEASGGPMYEHLSRPYLEKMKFLDRFIQPRKSYRNLMPNISCVDPHSSKSNGSSNMSLPVLCRITEDFQSLEQAMAIKKEEDSSMQHHHLQHHLQQQQQHSVDLIPIHNHQTSLHQHREHIMEQMGGGGGGGEGNSHHQQPSTSSSDPDILMQSSPSVSSLMSPPQLQINHSDSSQANNHHHHNTSSHQSSSSNNSDDENLSHHHSTSSRHHHHHHRHHSNNSQAEDENNGGRISVKNHERDESSQSFYSNGGVDGGGGGSSGGVEGRSGSGGGGGGSGVDSGISGSGTYPPLPFGYPPQFNAHYNGMHAAANQKPTLRSSDELLGELVTTELVKMSGDRKKYVQKKILEILFFDD